MTTSPTLQTDIALDPADPSDEAVSPSVWRYAMASRAHVVIDAAAYFELMHEAMLKARQRIMMVGWDFDTRIRLAGGRRWWNLPRKKRFPARFGAFVVWLVKHTKGLEVRVLKWNFGAFKFFFRGSMILDLARWYATPKIKLKFDSAHPLGCSHHQKIVIIDERFAVCGGIDMTSDRWDLPEHHENDARRLKINGKPYGPWHDLTMMVEGDAATALGALGRQRWEQAGGDPMGACTPLEGSAWPDRLTAEFHDVEVGISRTRAAYRSVREVLEIEKLFVEQIGRARKFIYAESQYFASRKIAEAIALKLAEPDPPEIILINPLTAEGWLEQTAMDGARVRLLHAIAEKDHAKRFRIFVPLASKGTPIYVHSKMMIIDDEIIRIGSANMNNRSMGLDSECDVFIDAARPANVAADIKPAIHGVRVCLLAEHCGLPVETIEQLLTTHGSMRAAIEAADMPGKRLVPFELRPLTETEIAVADSTLFDPERPEEMFEAMSHRPGLFRKGGILRRPSKEKAIA